MIVEVVASVNLWQLRAGHHAMVEDTDPYIARLIAARLLVPTDHEREPDEPERA